jgi:hypothetical protein
MNLEVSREEAELLRVLLRQRVSELDREINRTDSLEFKAGLRQLDRAAEQLLGKIVSAIEPPDPSDSIV